MKKRALCIMAALVCLALAAACSRQNTAFAPVESVSIGVGAFYQPANSHELLAGNLPANYEKIDSKVFPKLDGEFSGMLRAETRREYIGAERSLACAKAARKGDQAAAFNFWIEVGQCMRVDLLLVPYVIAWQEREGGGAGVVSPAGVTTDIFLLDVRKRALVGRSYYREVQKSLSDNLLEAGKFFSRGGKWVSAMELAREAMAKAIKELGL